MDNVQTIKFVFNHNANNVVLSDMANGFADIKKMFETKNNKQSDQSNIIKINLKKSKYLILFKQQFETHKKPFNICNIQVDLLNPDIIYEDQKWKISHQIDIDSGTCLIVSEKMLLYPNKYKEYDKIVLNLNEPSIFSVGVNTCAMHM